MKNEHNLLKFEIYIFRVVLRPLLNYEAVC